MQKRSRNISPVKYNTLHGKKQTKLSCLAITIFITCLAATSIFLSVTVIPIFVLDEKSSLSKFTSVSSSSSPGDGNKDTRSLSKKIRDWIPAHHSSQLSTIFKSDEPAPTWDQEFWTPIDLDTSSSDFIVTLCKLNFQQYSSSPHQYPMFRDLETLSKCMGKNRRREKLSVLITELKQKEGTPDGRIVTPTAFIFHESRVGSTLVANELASDPWSMVYSESAPTANALLYCNTLAHCDRQKAIQLFRDIVTLMGHSPFHKRLFFKFQSITSTRIDIALEAFPNTTWAFLYRTPVQTMMSHMDPAKASIGAPCLRSMRDTPKMVTEALDAVVSSGYRSAPKEAWCAAHLNMLCTYALQAYDKYSTRTLDDGRITQRGLLINYESLPGILPRVLLPLSDIIPSRTWLTHMTSEANYYSKGRGNRGNNKNGKSIFTSDSADKELRSTETIQLYSKSILESTYKQLNDASLLSISKASPAVYDMIKPTFNSDSGSNTNSGDSIKWASINSIPKKTSQFIDGIRRKMKFGNLLSNKNHGDGTHENKDTENEEEDDDDDNNNTEVEDKEGQDSTNNELKIPHSHIKKIPYEPWIPFANTHNSHRYESIPCPPTPPDGYPRTYPLSTITDNWNTDSTDIPHFHYDSLCHFNYNNSTEFEYARAYRLAEVPFIVYNVPEVDNIVKKWSDVDYIHKKLGSKPYRTETSKTNHFMYWAPGNPALLRGQHWEPPTTVIQESFEKWLETAIRGQNMSLNERKHEYFRVSSEPGNSWLYEELPFFQPKESFFMVNPREQQGIHCRFGMRNIIAEAHFDGSRNFIALFGGLRRYLLTHPNQCKYMHMLPKGHPSGRHSAIDWSKPDPEKFPNWIKLHGNEVILQPGDVMYLPTYWIHYIISLNVNYQCNTRSGRTREFDMDIKECGF